MIPLAEVDLHSGLAKIDADEKAYLAAEAAKGPQTRWQRIVASL